MIDMQLTDSQGSDILAMLAPPLSQSDIEGATDVKTLDNNISTYFTANKRQWEHTWPSMTIEEYNVLRGYYERQWTNYLYPLLTINGITGVNGVVVRMYMDKKDIIDNCETLENVAVTFRETEQLIHADSS